MIKLNDLSPESLDGYGTWDWKRITECRERIATESSYDADGVIRWDMGNILPPFVIETDAKMTCPESQRIAYQIDLDRTLATYRLDREENGYSDEELFEMRAAFGDGETVVDVITGETIKL